MVPQKRRILTQVTVTKDPLNPEDRNNKIITVVALMMKKKKQFG